MNFFIKKLIITVFITTASTSSLLSATNLYQKIALYTKKSPTAVKVAAISAGSILTYAWYRWYSQPSTLSDVTTYSNSDIKYYPLENQRSTPLVSEWNLYMSNIPDNNASVSLKFAISYLAKNINSFNDKSVLKFSVWNTDNRTKDADIYKIIFTHSDIALLFNKIHDIICNKNWSVIAFDTDNQKGIISIYCSFELAEQLHKQLNNHCSDNILHKYDSQEAL